MPFLKASTPTPSPRLSFPKRVAAGVAGGEAAAAGGGGGVVVVVGVPVEVGKEVAVLVAKGAQVVVESSRHPVCRGDTCCSVATLGYREGKKWMLFNKNRWLGCVRT